jgi:hypothetical protein
VLTRYRGAMGSGRQRVLLQVQRDLDDCRVAVAAADETHADGQLSSLSEITGQADHGAPRGRPT